MYPVLGGDVTLAGLEAHRTGEVLVTLTIGVSDLKAAICHFGKKLKLQNVDVYKNNEVISQTGKKIMFSIS